MERGDKRRRIVEAATLLLNRYGFQRTSMDLVAKEAGVAKPTIYAYFSDKDAVFTAVVEDFCEQLLQTAAQASQERGPLEARLTAILSAKFTRYWVLVQASPHAQELIDSHGRLGAEIIQRADRAYLALLEDVLAQAPELKKSSFSPQAAALLYLRAASGAAYDASSAPSHEANLREIVGVVTRGLIASK